MIVYGQTRIIIIKQRKQQENFTLDLPFTNTNVVHKSIQTLSFIVAFTLNVRMYMF